MKKHIALLFLLISSYTTPNFFTSKSFLSIRQQFRDVMPEKVSLFHDRMFAKKDGWHGALQAVPFGSQSSNTVELARYFLPFGKTQIVAGELGSKAVENGTADVIANYFGVLTQPTDEVFNDDPAEGFDVSRLGFESTVQFKPKQSVFGLGFSYQQHLWGTPENGFWIHISAPLMKVHNDVGMKEFITNPGGQDKNPEVPQGWANSMSDAFEGKPVLGGKHFKYGKIDPCGRSRWGLADIEIAIGSENQEHETCHRNWWGGIVIPTGNKPTGEYLFEPIVGNNGHAGVMFGSIYQHRIWTNNQDKQLWVNFHSQTRYLFTNTQRRAIDLVDKQWSRYLWVFPDNEHRRVPEDLEPGINHLTCKVQVSPRSALNINNGVMYSCNGLKCEAGINSYARQSEKVYLDCPFPEKIGIAGMCEKADFTTTTDQPTKSNATMRTYLFSQGITNDVDNADASCSTQDCSCNGNAQFVPIKEADLDTRSAMQPATISFMFYGTLGYAWDHLACPTLVSAGGSYEFSADNAGLERWTLWGKLGISF